MPQITVKNLTFSYENSFDYIFENVSFSIDTDWKLGFIGRNGKGKTTFLNLMMGKYSYSGVINCPVKFDYFPYKVDENLKMLNTVDIAEIIYPGFELWKLQRELNLLKAGDDVLFRAFDTLSGGEQTKVILAVLFLKEDNFLLIDEPTNHLDTEARQAVCEYLNKKKGFILVSHDRMFLDNCVDHVLSLNKTNIEVQKGNFSSWKTNKDRNDSFEQSKNEKLKTEIGRLKEAGKRKSDWSNLTEKSKYSLSESSDRGYIGHKSAKVMKTAKALENRTEKAIEEKSSLLKNFETIEDLKISPLVFSNDKYIDAKNLSVFYGEKTVFKKLSFTLCRGERMAVIGKNGSGKSSLLKLILGEKTEYEGFIKIGSNLKISYVPQLTESLKGNIKNFSKENGIDEIIYRSVLDKFGFDKKQFDKNMEGYSEGQKKKIYLAKSICEKAHVYIWDEPLNYIDIYSRIQIEKMILKYNPTMIFIEHDLEFVKNIATQIIYI